jgi:hypothetical protein
MKFSFSESNYSRSTNPCLSLSNDKQTSNIEYNCDLYDKNETSSVPDNASGITYNILDTNDFNGDDIKDLSDEATQQEGLKPTQPLQNTTMNRFQIMLQDLINKHKASLQMYDKICHLVNKYVSSLNFSYHLKLQSRKSFLKSIEDTNQTHTLRPTNVNV